MSSVEIGPCRSGVGQPGTREPGRRPAVRQTCSIAVITALLQEVQGSAGRVTDEATMRSSPFTKRASPWGRGRDHAYGQVSRQVTHSLWTAVEMNYNRATAQPDRLEGVITASAFALTARDARPTPRHDAEDFGSRRRSRLRRTLPRQTRSNSDALIAQGDPSPDGPAGPGRRCRG